MYAKNKCVKRKYNLEDPKDVEIVLGLLEEMDDNEGEETNNEYDNNYSDEEEDILETRDELTDTEQEVDSSDSESDEITQNYYLGRDKISKWKKSHPPKNVRTRKQNIVTHLPGVKGSAKLAKTSKECWECFFDENILQTIVKYTNQKITEVRPNYERERDARPTNLIEIKALFGILYLCAARKDNHTPTKDIWALDKTGIELCRLIMSERRFRFLLYCLRFDDKETRQNRREIDNLAPIRDIFDSFVNNCQKSYSVGEYCTIDEKLESFRGKCRFRQYIPSKPSKYGIKIFALVDARMYYTLNLEIYAGTQPNGAFQVSNKAIDVVKRLSTVISGTGRNITLDNWFVSLELAHYLYKNNLTLVGTVRKNKTEIPPAFTETKSRKVESSMFGFMENCTLVSYLAKKNKVVLAMSTMHNDAAIDISTNEKLKPEIITFYNCTKSGVDTVDQLCSTYNVARKTNRWPMVVFYSMLNIAGINAQIIYTSNNKTNAIHRSRFLKNLARELADEFLHMRSQCTSLPKELKRDIQSLLSDATEVQQPMEEEPNPKRRRCHKCGRSKNRYSKYQCRNCKQSLCLEHAQQICAEC